MKTEKNYMFKMNMKTRDYECDVQGVINNANYQHYLEVTRHEFLQQVCHTSFQKLHDEGIDLMVSNVNISYKSSLHGGEEFVSCMNLRRKGVRYVFDQEIYRISDNVLCIKATTDCVCVVNGTLSRGEELVPYLPELDKA